MGGKQSKPNPNKKGGFFSYFKNHCPGCGKNYSIFNIFRLTRKCEYDDNVYCRVCTKIIVIPDEKEKYKSMIVCFHCELLLNKSNKSVVEKFSPNTYKKSMTFND